MTYKDIINPVFPYKLVDMIDETKFQSDAHKVRELNERLDPVAWVLLQDLLKYMKIK